MQKIGKRGNEDVPGKRGIEGNDWTRERERVSEYKKNVRTAEEEEGMKGRLTVAETLEVRLRRRGGEWKGREEKVKGRKEGGRFEGQKRKILRWKAREREGGRWWRWKEKGCVAVKR